GGPAVGRERLADDTLPDVVVRMVERLAGGGLRGRARGEQQQREAAAERAAEHEHRYLLVSLEARSGNYGREPARGQPAPACRSAGLYAYEPRHRVQDASTERGEREALGVAAKRRRGEGQPRSEERRVGRGGRARGRLPV